MDSLAVATEERPARPLGRDRSARGDRRAFLDIAHERFNQKRYREAAAAYEDFLRRFPDSAHHAEARYQAGLCYLRLDRAGDAVDRFESIVHEAPASPLGRAALGARRRRLLPGREVRRRAALLRRPAGQLREQQRGRDRVAAPRPVRLQRGRRRRPRSRASRRRSRASRTRRPRARPGAARSARSIA
jgi:tetratricopeptide (TPR) repeat protein